MYDKFTNEQIINELQFIINCMATEIWPERARISIACKAARERIRKNGRLDAE